jgi:hypothetical protein
VPADDTPFKKIRLRGIDLRKGKSNLLRTAWVALTCLSILGILTWLYFDSLPLTVRLPDGTRLSLLQVTYGRKHRFAIRTAPWWQVWQPPHTLNETSSPIESLALGLMWQEASGAGPLSRLAPQTTPWNWAEVRDETGSTAHYFYPYSFGIYGNPTAPTMLFGYQCFPRRGKRLTVRYFDGMKPNPVAEFTFPNPVTDTFPVWQPDYLPSTRKEGSLSLTLVKAGRTPYCVLLNKSVAGYEVVSKEDFQVQKWPKTQKLMEISVPTVHIEVREDGHSTRQWTFGEVTLSDAMGNVTPLHSMTIYGNSYSFSFSPPYCSGENIGKIHTELYLNEDSDFDTSEQIRVESELELPAIRAFVKAPKTVDLAGIPAEVYLTGGGNVPIPPTLTLKTNGPCVVLILPKTAADLHPLLRVTDEAGHLITRYSGDAYASGGGISGSRGNRMNLSYSYTAPQSPPYLPLHWAGPGQTLEADNKVRYLLYPLPGTRPGMRLNVTLVANKGRHFEFCTAFDSAIK